jgi:hypothetical protein
MWRLHLCFDLMVQGNCPLDANLEFCMISLKRGKKKKKKKAGGGQATWRCPNQMQDSNISFSPDSKIPRYVIDSSSGRLRYIFISTDRVCEEKYRL